METLSIVSIFMCITYWFMYIIDGKTMKKR